MSASYFAGKLATGAPAKLEAENGPPIAPKIPPLETLAPLASIVGLERPIWPKLAPAPFTLPNRSNGAVFVFAGIGFETPLACVRLNSAPPTLSKAILIVLLFATNGLTV